MFLLDMKSITLVVVITICWECIAFSTRHTINYFPKNCFCKDVQIFQKLFTGRLNIFIYLKYRYMMVPRDIYVVNVGKDLPDLMTSLDTCELTQEKSLFLVPFVANHSHNPLDFWNTWGPMQMKKGLYALFVERHFHVIQV